MFTYFRCFSFGALYVMPGFLSIDVGNGQCRLVELGRALHV